MKNKTTGIVEKCLEARRIILGAVVPKYVTVVHRRQDVRFEIQDQKRARKKPVYIYICCMVVVNIKGKSVPISRTMHTFLTFLTTTVHSIR